MTQYINSFMNDIAFLFFGIIFICSYIMPFFTIIFGIIILKDFDVYLHQIKMSLITKCPDVVGIIETCCNNKFLSIDYNHYNFKILLVIGIILASYFLLMTMLLTSRKIKNGVYHIVLSTMIIVSIVMVSITFNSSNISIDTIEKNKSYIICNVDNISDYKIYNVETGYYMLNFINYSEKYNLQNVIFLYGFIGLIITSFVSILIGFPTKYSFSIYIYLKHKYRMNNLINSQNITNEILREITMDETLKCRFENYLSLYDILTDGCFGKDNGYTNRRIILLIEEKINNIPMQVITNPISNIIPNFDLCDKCHLCVGKFVYIDTMTNEKTDNLKLCKKCCNDYIIEIDEEDENDENKCVICLEEYPHFAYYKCSCKIPIFCLKCILVHEEKISTHKTQCLLCQTKF